MKYCAQDYLNLEKEREELVFVSSRAAGNRTKKKKNIKNIAKNNERKKKQLFFTEEKTTDRPTDRQADAQFVHMKEKL